VARAELVKAAAAIDKSTTASAALLDSVSQLQAVSAKAYNASTGLVDGWAVDVGTILNRPLSTGVSVEELRRFCTETLKITCTTDRILIADCLVPELRRAIAEWYEMHDVHPDNIDSVSDQTIEAQLSARFADPESRVDWIRRHLGLALPFLVAPRFFLRKLLIFSQLLDHCMQKRTFASELEVEEDGSAKVVEYIRKMELFVICILHAYMRIGEKIMNLQLYELRGRHELSMVERARRWSALAAGVNRIMHGGKAKISPTPPEPAASPPAPAPPVHPLLHGLGDPAAVSLPATADPAQPTAADRSSAYFQRTFSGQQDVMPDGVRKSAAE
ncbi:hypothetical protein B484DRAFT_440275, partial [Ochromonadaceae sp. CCMP2298]